MHTYSEGCFPWRRPHRDGHQLDNTRVVEYLLCRPPLQCRVRDTSHPSTVQVHTYLVGSLAPLGPNSNRSIAAQYYTWVAGEVYSSSLYCSIDLNYCTVSTKLSIPTILLYTYAQLLKVVIPRPRTRRDGQQLETHVSG